MVNVMNILEKYIEMSENSNVFNKYYKCGKKNYGNMFMFKNTNYRTILTFESSYKKFKKVNGINRSDWEKNELYNQEKDKHRTVRMLGTKLFSKNERIFYKTEKGNVLEKIIINEEKFSQSEKWILIYFLILDSYFNNKANYIKSVTNYFFENFITSGMLEEDIEEELKKIILVQDKEIKDLIRYKYLYMDTFKFVYNGYDFLNDYISSSKEQKDQLYIYIENNLKNKNSCCIISKKYASNGNYTKDTLIDNAKLLFMTIILKNNKISFKEFVKNLVERYSNIEKNIDTGKILNFIFKNRDVFEIIYYNIFEIDYLGLETNYTVEGEIEESKIDDTSTKNSNILKRTSAILKKKAKERSDYKCELEKICGCDNFYFTSKETNQNYLEIHHFIPREFSNDFERSIEIIDNYITLCPRCHRMIHLATDRERKTLINYIYDNRSKRLEEKGLKITKKEIIRYYNIER